MNMGRMQRTKGAKFERDVVRRINAIDGWTAVRGLQSRGGRSLPDVRARLADIELHIECTHGRNPPIPAKWRQAMRDHREGATPLVWARYHGGWEMVVMRWEDFAKFPVDSITWVRHAACMKNAIEKAATTSWHPSMPLGVSEIDGEPMAGVLQADFVRILGRIK